MGEKDIQKDDLVGKTKAIRDHDHDMIHDLSKRLDAVWRYDQYIENADKFPELQRFWQESKQTEIQTIERLKELIREPRRCTMEVPQDQTYTSLKAVRIEFTAPA